MYKLAIALSFFFVFIEVITILRKRDHVSPVFKTVANSVINIRTSNVIEIYLYGAKLYFSHLFIHLSKFSTADQCFIFQYMTYVFLNNL